MSKQNQNDGGILSTLLGIFLGLTEDNKTKKTKDKKTLDITKNYDPWNFEEEELEDDDYYNEDLD